MIKEGGKEYVKFGGRMKKKRQSCNPKWDRQNWTWAKKRKFDMDWRNKKDKNNEKEEEQTEGKEEKEEEEEEEGEEEEEEEEMK